MSTTDTEYVIAPWGAGDCETSIVTVELPAREVVAQVEVPNRVLERTQEIADEHDISIERALAERLERNRARVSLLAAQTVSDVTEIRDHLTDAADYLAVVDSLDTTELETEVDRIWRGQLDPD
ncbi:hypothetical protein VB773_15425 [Haloarculaceae archaeon H-GB2-1]|nr:hypothetical protein [Haloarculaceae archaeon H-GB1-1]MEA5387349.1 hypothetical protein [Haloarculaceae archaeon H-GB11]MEA5408818.1 hypothetical protein [Haloarculaceae archaeon H-GB2-1]